MWFGPWGRWIGKTYSFDAVIQGVPGIDTPFDVRAEFGRGRVPTRATFDGGPCDGSLLRMGTPGPHPRGS